MVDECAARVFIYTFKLFIYNLQVYIRHSGGKKCVQGLNPIYFQWLVRFGDQEVKISVSQIMESVLDTVLCTVIVFVLCSGNDLLSQCINS